LEFHVQRHGTIPSSSDIAFESIERGDARHGDVHIAAAQTRGRGRQGRTWHSEPGAGLYASIVLLPERVLPPAALTIAAGLAVHDAVRELGLVAAQLKWPNDVVAPCAGGVAKIAGILVETRGLDPAQPHYVVGIGVNVAQTSFPPELIAERAVASLTLCNIRTDVDRVLDILLVHLARRLAQIDADRAGLARDYLAATNLEHADVVVSAGESEHAGRIEALDVDEGLLLADMHGSVRRFALEIVRSLRVANVH